MKKVLIFLMALSLFAACNNDKGKLDKKADYREKDDYGTNDDQSNEKIRKDEDRNNDENTSSDGWTERERSKFLADCMGESGGNQGRAKKICSCVLEKLEKKYTSLSDADERGGEAAGKQLATECVEEVDGSNNNEETNNDKSDYADGWTRSDEAKFVSECFGTASKNVGRTRANQYCDCMLDKIKKMYSSYTEANLKLGRMSQDQINRLAEDCNNQ